MPHQIHTYGSTCQLSRKTIFPGPRANDDIPHIGAQFFYSSPLPIDDPLSALPTPTGSNSKSVKHPPRPFSARDNAALEEAWLSLASDGNEKTKGKSTSSSSKKTYSSYPTDGGDATGIQNPELISRDQERNSRPGIARVIGTSDGLSYFSNNSGGESQPDSLQFKNQRLATNVVDWEQIDIDETESFSRLDHTKYQESPIDTEFQKRHDLNSKIEAPSVSNKSATQHGKSDHIKPDIPSSSAEDSLPYDVSDLLKARKQTIAFDIHRETDHEILLPSLNHSCTFDGLSADPEAGKKSDVQFIGTRKRGRDGQQQKSDDEGPTDSPAAVGVPSSQQDTSPNYLNPPISKRKREAAKPSKGDANDPITPSGGDESGSAAYLSEFSSRSRQVESGTSGMPFLKYGSTSASLRSTSPSYRTQDINDTKSTRPRGYDRSSELDLAGLKSLGHNCRARRNAVQYTDVPVGISRLHLVKLPSLQMHPIYWSPVHDIATVIRATWFYKETMYPVEPDVANALETGYRELRPWSQTWNDELNCALEVGAAGEEKISHRLWAEDDAKISGLQDQSYSIVSAGPHCAARCFHGEAAAEGSIDSSSLHEISAPKVTVKGHSQSHVIYKDAHTAFILKPSLQPSAYHGRRPLQKIKKDITVGIPVVRGFDWKSWEKCHPSTKSKIAEKVTDTAPGAVDVNTSEQSLCAACRLLEERPRVTDLILVIHGIGQKLSERVESFHFTHAINTFRRSVNVELCNESVQRVVRDNLGGVMVLPVNWRSNLSFEDGGPLKDGGDYRGPSKFSLNDITPKTIPAVRNLISDVMLDIPFYMSHHKPKMIQALIEEANRVYRLWCKNNPSFHNEGRVHIIAHSLGSAMALEVLSNQPTSVPKVNLTGKNINTKYFDFSTTNLFFCGSPAGFFLLLDKGTLIPRRNQSKSGVEQRDDHDPALTGEAGTFGCLAVDNIYNIIHYNDPIAYRLNATVDTQYAATLKNAQVPSATVGFFESISNTMKSITPGVSATSEPTVGQMIKPSSVARLPSQLEMAIHDFTREEMAEKKFALLNDNLQVDWFLSSGGGPLQVRYLNMLGAHSSYWGSPDFIRMIVLECGRKPGKKNTFPNMKAVKMGHKP